MARRRSKPRDLRLVRVPLLVLVTAIVLLAVFAFANAILGVNSPRLGQNTAAIDLVALEPPECRAAGIVPTNLVTGNSGAKTSDLILGTSAGNTLKGGNGDDCIVGGNGNDTINGGAGTNDVCIGGPGTDTFSKCEHTYQ